MLIPRPNYNIERDMSDKEKYRLLCESETGIAIFSRDWWLDSVCGNDRWDVILVEKKGRILAALPIYTPLRSVVSMPSYTQIMGPWLADAPADMKYSTNLGRRQELLKELINGLNGFSSFLQNFNYDITDWLPFYWNGYSQSTRYTYILDDIDDGERLWNNMSSNIRRNIIKARDKQRIGIKRGIAVDELLKLQAMSFERQGLRVKEDIDTLRGIIDVCRKRGQGDLWGAYDENGVLHSAAFVVWQKSSAYYLAGGGDPALRSSGAHSLLLWSVINDVAKYTSRFDFEGSMLPGVERFFREFGAIQKPFFTITKGKLSLLDRVRIKLGKRR